MLSRPSLRAVLATTAAAGLLVGGANLASYAATHHGHGAGASAAAKSTQPKTITFHLGKPGKKFAGSSTHLVSAKVPKGTYEVAMTGLILDPDTIASTDSYSCLVSDRRTILKALHGSITPATYTHFYALDGDGQGSFKFGALDSYNPAQRIDRPTIALGCIFSGTTPWTIARTLTFTLRPVKVTSEHTSPILVARSQARRLSSLLR
jgi:hypothetical protein